MPITTNETHSSGSSDLSKEELSKGDLSKLADGGGGGATGVEVPVIVHASRYSSSANSVGKTLPPVHEETRTVIVFEQGAVVRLSAAVTTGEVVVLTNKVTGADVICKVGNVKAQPGIQNYVSLEFTQRAPGFWGESSQLSRAPQAPAVEAAPAVIADTTLPSPTSTSPILSSPALTSPTVETISAAKPSPVATVPDEPIPAPASVLPPPVPPAAIVAYEHTAIAAGVAESISALPAALASPAPPAKVFEAGSTLGLRHSGPAAVGQRPIELAIPPQSSTREGKNLALIGVAAVALFFAGGVATWLLLRPGHSAEPTSQAASAPLQTPAVTTEAALQPQAPTVPDGALPAAVPAEPDAASSAATLHSELRAAPQAETPAIQPAVAKSANASPAAASTSASSASASSASASSASAASTANAPATEASHRPVLDIGKMAAPSVKKKASGAISSEAPPELLAQSGTVPGASLNDGLLSASARGNGLSAPFPSAPSKGGSLTQPKLISSPAALYPAEARTAHIQGDVAIDVFIDESGKVAATKVISGPPVLQQAAISAVRSWKYQPARLDGQPISIHIRVDVNFQIQ